MHELPITENILDISLRHAKRAGARRITDIYLVIGQLSSIVDDSIQFYWDIISKDTLAEGARLHFERIPANLTCQDCGREFTIDGELTPCPDCQSLHLKVTGGDGFRLESIGIET